MHGAKKIFAVDVGHGQLDPKIANDPRVVNIERTNARDLEPLPHPPQAIVADLSFVSLKLALPPALKMAASGAWLIALVKPQFEAGRANVGKGGIVRDESVQDAVLAEIATWIPSNAGWSAIGTMDSPVRGGDGNREFLIAARKS
jgi:23S rRNA (cytidine1920-2'-O)/16S rRNA (cytidine1409-2'-O)-methyltransferase